MYVFGELSKNTLFFFPLKIIKAVLAAFTVISFNTVNHIRAMLSIH